MTNLHLGCLHNPIPGWINTDVTRQIFVARVPFAASALRQLGLITQERFEQHRRGVFKQVRYMNASKRFPMDDESVDNAFCAHMLEHLTRDQAVHCVREVHRVLKPGGVFRVTVPDLDMLVRAYDPERPEEMLTTLYSPHQARFENQHHWMYNEHSLARLMREVGFSQAYRCEFQKGRCPDLDKLDNRPLVTLFMEGVK